MMRYYSEYVLIQSRGPDVIVLAVRPVRWRVFRSRLDEKTNEKGVDSGSPRFQPVVKPGTPGMDLLWGPTRALERCGAPGWMDGMDGARRERTSERASEDTHKRYLEFLRGFSRKYSRPIVPGEVLSRRRTSHQPTAAAVVAASRGRRPSRFSRGLLMRHAIGS